MATYIGQWNPGQRGRPLGPLRASRSGLAAAKARPSGAQARRCGAQCGSTRTITRVRKNERLAKDMVR
jgi:hypothetical protein